MKPSDAQDLFEYHSKAQTVAYIPWPVRTMEQVKEALKAKETGEEKVILTALCGHGHFDLAAYDQFLNGNMVDSVLSDKDFEAALAALPVM